MNLKPNDHHILLIYYYIRSVVWELDVAFPKEASKYIGTYTGPNFTNFTLTYDKEPISTYISSRLQTIPKENVEKKLCTKIASLCAGTTLRRTIVFQNELYKVGGKFAAELEVSARKKDWENNHLKPYYGGTTKLKEELRDGLVVRLAEGEQGYSWE